MTIKRTEGVDNGYRWEDARGEPADPARLPQPGKSGGSDKAATSPARSCLLHDEPEGSAVQRRRGQAHPPAPVSCTFTVRSTCSTRATSTCSRLRRSSGTMSWWGCTRTKPFGPAGASHPILNQPERSLGAMACDTRMRSSWASGGGDARSHRHVQRRRRRRGGAVRAGAGGHPSRSNRVPRRWESSGRFQGYREGRGPDHGDDHTAGGGRRGRVRERNARKGKAERVLFAQEERGGGQGGEGSLVEDRGAIPPGAREIK